MNLPQLSLMAWLTPSRCRIWVLAAALFLWPASLFAQNSKLPPAPDLPELTEEACDRQLQNLSADDYQLRETANQILMQGGVETAAKLTSYVETADAEGKARAVEIALRIYQKLLLLQCDDEALATREYIEQMTLLDDPLIARRIEMFQTIHHGLQERASIRTLVRLNAVLDFQRIARSMPGISERDFTTELPLHIFLGENWLGNEQDLSHIQYLLELGERNLGTNRGIYRIQGCPVSLETLQDLALGLTGVQVLERSRARLGISTDGQSSLVGAAWAVSQILPGSSAAHAGLRRGDTLVRVNDEIINTFDDLTRKLEAYKPPDQVVLDVFRDTTPSQSKTGLMPASFEEFGLEIDPEFHRFALVKSVKPGSPADQLKLTSRMRIESMNGHAIRNIASLKLAFEHFEQGDALLMTVREAEQISMTLRPWVGPYR